MTEARDFLALVKPRITANVLMTTAGGFWLAPRPLQGHGDRRALFALVGTILIVAGANALNMYLERDIDGRVPRTKNRPLPSGRMAAHTALLFGAFLGVLAIPVLALGVNLLTGMLGLLSFFIYVAIYTPLKQHSPVALVVGAIPGAMPPLMGWTAATGHLDVPGLVLFAIMFLWQLPHFLAITLYRSGEMSRAGFKVLAVEKGARAAKRRIVLYLAALVPVSLLLVPLHVAGLPYLVVAAGAGAWFFVWGVRGLRAEAGTQWARSLFNVSLLYLVILFAALATGRVWLYR
jgi:protoheme IX farnesyltransferase